jgi:hypothetical protein
MSRIQNLFRLLKSNGGSENPKFFPGLIFPKLYEFFLAENMPILTSMDMLHLCILFKKSPCRGCGQKNDKLIQT